MFNLQFLFNFIFRPYKKIVCESINHWILVFFNFPKSNSAKSKYVGFFKSPDGGTNILNLFHAEF